MELKTVKVEFGKPKGFHPLTKTDYAVFYQELLHRTQKTVNALTRQYLVPSEGDPPKLTVQEDGMKLTGNRSFDVDMANVDWDAVNDAIIVGQVKEWSFGPVSQETLDGLPESIHTELVNHVNQLYSEQRPLPDGGGGK